MSRAHTAVWAFPAVPGQRGGLAERIACCPCGAGSSHGDFLQVLGNLDRAIVFLAAVFGLREYEEHLNWTFEN